MNKSKIWDIRDLYMLGESVDDIAEKQGVTIEKVLELTDDLRV
jgi:hypothetical protein